MYDEWGPDTKIGERGGLGKESGELFFVENGGGATRSDAKGSAGILKQLQECEAERNLEENGPPHHLLPPPSPPELSKFICHPRQIFRARRTDNVLTHYHKWGHWPTKEGEKKLTCFV